MISMEREQLISAIHEGISGEALWEMLRPVDYCVICSAAIPHEDDFYLINGRIFCKNCFVLKTIAQTAYQNLQYICDDQAKQIEDLKKRLIDERASRKTSFEINALEKISVDAAKKYRTEAKQELEDEGADLS